VLGLNAQSVIKIDGISFNYKEVPVYDVFGQPDIGIRLELGYGTDVVLDPENWNDRWRGVKIPYEINIIYTKFPTDTSKWGNGGHYQLALKRWKKLLQFDPALKQGNIDRNLVLQTKCKTEAEARKMFHGYVIKFYYDIKDIYKLVEPFIDKITSEKDSLDSYNGLTEEERRYYANYVWAIMQNTYDAKDVYQDSVVLKTLNKHKEWRDILLVVDLTGSMYPYFGQFLLWFEKNRFRVKHIVFFNDGDDALHNYTKVDQSDKPIGNTGGIYFAEPNFESIRKSVVNCVMNGVGGYWPENNLEAVIKAMNKYNDYKDIVMIADARSAIRDIALVNKINKPVHTIVCRKECCPHPTYITLAEKVKGSLHTMESELDFGSANPSLFFKESFAEFDGCTYKKVSPDFLGIVIHKKKKGKGLFQLLKESLEKLNDNLDRKLKEKHSKK
jgi:hypothetical protein